MKRMLCAAITALVAGTAWLAGTMWPQPAHAAAPRTVAVQGVLRSAGGGPAADGNYSMRFAIYPAAKGGAPAWSEGPVTVSVTRGRFSYELGAVKPLDAAALAALPRQWLGVAIGNDPELPRKALASTLFSLFAGRAAKAASLDCQSCVSPKAVNFTYAGSNTRGGAALRAEALSCSGCVGIDQLKFDKNVSLGSHALSAAKLTSNGDILAAGTVAAKAFAGDGSQLTGIRMPSGSCPKGQAVGGIDAAGKLKCAVAGGELDSVSGGLVTQHFVDVYSGAKGLDIPDMDSDGLLDVIDVPDVGVAEKIEVSIEINRAPFVDVKPADGKPDYDPRDLTIMLFPPTSKDLPAKPNVIVNNFTTKPSVDSPLYPHYVLHQGTGEGKLALIATYPVPDKAVSGDLGEWIGKNARGKWRLFILDNKDRLDAEGHDVKIDGKLVSWSIRVGYKATKKIHLKGDLVLDGTVYSKGGGLKLPGSDNEPAACSKAIAGFLYFDSKLKKMRYCDGAFWQSLAGSCGNGVINKGEECDDGNQADGDGCSSKCRLTVARSCQVIRSAGVVQSGMYLIDPDGKGPIAQAKTWCDMSSEGGGWTRFLRYGDPNGLTPIPTKTWDAAIRRAAAGGITQWLIKTYGSPADDSAKGSKFINAWILNLAAKVQGSKFTHFTYHTPPKCGQHRYFGPSYIDSAKLLPGSTCKGFTPEHNNGRYLWGEHHWCGRSDTGQMWLSYCSSPRSHLLIVNHNYNYPPRYTTMINASHGAGRWGEYDEDGGVYEFFYR